MEPMQLYHEIVRFQNLPLAFLISTTIAGLSDRYKLAWILLICTFISTARIAGMV